MDDAFLFEPLNNSLKNQIEPSPTLSSSYWKEGWERLKTNKPALFGLYTLFFLIIMAILGPMISSYTYYEMNLSLKNSPPSTEFWFGTDALGRDIFTRTWVGARISLFIGITASLIDLLIGVLYGAIAGYWGGKLEEMMMRSADILYALPSILIVILLMVVIGSGLTSILLALTLTGWIGMARIVRGQILQLKSMDFIKAAHAMGASPWRIMKRHLIPNTIGPIIVTLTFTIPTAIFTEAFLSFLGLGVQAPVASWGTMANEGLSSLRYYPWQLFFPAGFISLTMLSFNILGNGLNDALDPRLRK